MGEANGPTKPILFSIGSYKEEKKKINKITPAKHFSVPNSVPPSPTHYKPRRLTLRDRPVSLDITDAPPFKSLQQQSSHKLTFQNGSRVTSPDEIDKPACPPSVHNGNGCPVVPEHLEMLEKPAHPPKLYTRSYSLEHDQLRHSGKVALTIAAYEGECRTPTRMSFLPPQSRLSRSSSKASDIIILEETDCTDGPILNQLQTELVATLKRSNLKKRHDSFTNETTADESKVNDEPKADIVKNDEKTITEEDKSISGDAENMNINVKQLTTELGKTLTFKLNPDES
ncbi:uncharacterized protein LOC106646051 [Copidosoma floridanum]|uniref:uncharacterized protein LOC106646051 n=1 Tax=Copidosoma floridanum TaxID=29053 RepID=UPI0006C9A396|nr:uncharacterized protein LOC106646051 [Copidosoma floridanum]